MSRVILGLSASALAISMSFTPAKAVEVYLFKGAGDFSFINEKMHFSRGLESIRDELQKDGIHAVVRRHGNTASAMREIKKRKPKSVAFVGHSMGALASMSMAKRMKALGIKVAYVGTLDIPGPIGVAGSNVEKAENYYSISPIYGLLTNVRKHKDATNIHVFGTHTTMDDSKKVFNGVVSAVRAIHQSEQEELQPVIEPAPQLLVEAKPETELNTVAVLQSKDVVRQTNETVTASIKRPAETIAANLETETSFASVSQPIASPAYDSAEDIGEPINLLRRLDTETSVQPQKTAPIQQAVRQAPVESEQSSGNSRLLDRVRSVLKRNGRNLRRRSNIQTETR